MVSYYTYQCDLTNQFLANNFLITNYSQDLCTVHNLRVQNNQGLVASLKQKLTVVHYDIVQTCSVYSHADSLPVLHTHRGSNLSLCSAQS